MGIFRASVYHLLPPEAGEGVRFLRTGVADGLNHHVGVRNQIWILCKKQPVLLTIEPFHQPSL